MSYHNSPPSDRYEPDEIDPSWRVLSSPTDEEADETGGSANWTSVIATLLVTGGATVASAGVTARVMDGSIVVNGTPLKIGFTELLWLTIPIVALASLIVLSAPYWPGHIGGNR